MLTPLELTQKLISLPSYVDKYHDETPVTDFLVDFLATSLPSMTVKKQYIDSKRYNVILKGRGEPKLFVLGHVDTVLPKSGWSSDPLQPLVKDGCIYGLGASDMKGSLAAFLCALINKQKSIKIDNLMLLMYVDEEYDFAGIQRFAKSEYAAIAPTLTLSLDGELAVATGCRGVIELNLTCRGRSGHSANPNNGTNVITGAVAALQEVNDELVLYSDPDLGTTTTNVAAIRGGVVQEANDETTWLQEGNVIPDTAEIVFEVRPSVSRVTAELVQQKIRSALERRNLHLDMCSVRHDIAPWPVDLDNSAFTILEDSYKKAGMPFAVSSRQLQGYIDAQIIAEKIATPTYIIGTGGNNKHGANENLPLENLNNAVKVYTALLEDVLA